MAVDLRDGLWAVLVHDVGPPISEPPVQKRAFATPRAPSM